MGIRTAWLFGCTASRIRGLLEQQLTHIGCLPARRYCNHQLASTFDDGLVGGHTASADFRQGAIGVHLDPAGSPFRPKGNI